jgi:hypothetical protein
LTRTWENKAALVNAIGLYAALLSEPSQDGAARLATATEAAIRVLEQNVAWTSTVDGEQVRRRVGDVIHSCAEHVLLLIGPAAQGDYCGKK